MKKNVFFIALLFLFSCQKTEINNELLEGNSEIPVTSRNVLFTPKQMAQISFGERQNETRSVDRVIAVFPLILDSKLSSIYAVVNYTDSTTLLTTQYVNYPDNFIAFFDKMVIDSTVRVIENMPEVLSNVLRGYDADIERFSKDSILVNAPLGYVSTKVVDDGFRPPAGCRVEIENTYLWSKITASYGPLTTTQWGQSSPYNQLTPNGASAGCVPVALGQILRYYRFPTSLPYCGVVPYESMPNSPAGTINSNLTSEYIAPFLLYIGNEVHTDYGASKDEESETLMFRAKDFLERFYRVSKDSPGRRFDSGHIEKCCQTLKSSNIILISGDEDGGGHAWVLDGYEASSRIQNQVYRYYDQNNNLIYVQHLENPVGVFERFHHNLGWRSQGVWLDVHADMAFGNTTFNRNIDLFYVSKY